MRKNGSAIYLHWTAGNYNSIGGPYHTVFTGDGTMHRKFEYDKSTGGHTYNRNSGGSVGLSLAANPDKNQWPTEAQKNSMAKESARIAKAWGWTAGDINMEKVMTHGEAGSNVDGYNAHTNYGPFGRGRSDTHSDKDDASVGGIADVERWDLDKLYSHNDLYGSGGDEMRERIKGFMRMGGPTRGRGFYEMGEEGEEFVLDNDSFMPIESVFPGGLSKINRAKGKDAVDLFSDMAIEAKFPGILDSINNVSDKKSIEILENYASHTGLNSSYGSNDNKMSITPGIGEGGATNSLTNQQKVKTSGGIIHNIFDTFGKKEIDSQTILRNIKSKVNNMSTFMSEMVSDEKKENILGDNKLLDVINNVSDKKTKEQKNIAKQLKVSVDSGVEKEDVKTKTSSVSVPKRGGNRSVASLFGKIKRFFGYGDHKDKNSNDKMGIAPGIGEGEDINALTNQMVGDHKDKNSNDKMGIAPGIGEGEDINALTNQMVGDEKKENILRDNKLLDVINNVSDKKSIEVLENYASYENTQTQVIIVERESEEPMEESEGSSTRQFMTSTRQKAEDWSEPLLWL